MKVATRNNVLDATVGENWHGRHLMADGTLLTIVIAVASPLIAAGGLYLGWKKMQDDGQRHADSQRNVEKRYREAQQKDALHREEEALRLGEVLAWANEAIREFQSLVVICRLREEELDKARAKEKLLDIVFNTSILIERGRLFFKNDPSAYRPKVLDQLLIAYLAARRCMTANDDDRQRMLVVVEDCERQFLSLMQAEVGRDRTRDPGAGKGGDSINLDSLLKQVTPERLKKVQETLRAT
jgi:hypothetical protein